MNQQYTNNNKITKMKQLIQNISPKINITTSGLFNTSGSPDIQCNRWFIMTRWPKNPSS